MVKFEKFILDNGLTVLFHEDRSTPMAAVNVLYNVGARDEDPQRTGFAHLFEHLMFGGSLNIPDYDTPLQRVGGENNAFTSNDITNYYITLPAVNFETACWLESDRMLDLAFSDKSLEVQKQVVCEEFKQRYLNQPYGDVWLKLRPLAYKVHPYRWATIGEELSHIENAEMEDVRHFFRTHYHPGNAILVVGGDLDPATALQTIEKWFGTIPGTKRNSRNLPQEPPQTEARRAHYDADVPSSSIYIAFHGVERLHPDYHGMDLLSDLLSRGQSSRLYQSLVKDQELFTEVNAYVLGSIDSNLFIVEGKPATGISLTHGEEALWSELQKLIDAPIPQTELDKVQNKTESLIAFNEMSLLERAMNLAYFELLGDADLINHEQDAYLKVTQSDIQRLAQQIFRKENSSTMIYRSTHDATE